MAAWKLSDSILFAGCDHFEIDWLQGTWRYSSSASMQADGIELKEPPSKRFAAAEAEHANDRLTVHGRKATLLFLDIEVELNLETTDGHQARFQGTAENRIGHLIVTSTGVNQVELTLHFPNGQREDISLGLYDRIDDNGPRARNVVTELRRNRSGNKRLENEKFTHRPVTPDVRRCEVLVDK